MGGEGASRRGAAAGEAGRGEAPDTPGLYRSASHLHRHPLAPILGTGLRSPPMRVQCKVMKQGMVTYLTLGSSGNNLRAGDLPTPNSSRSSTALTFGVTSLALLANRSPSGVGGGRFEGMEVGDAKRWEEDGSTKRYRGRVANGIRIAVVEVSPPDIVLWWAFVWSPRRCVVPEYTAG